MNLCIEMCILTWQIFLQLWATELRICHLPSWLLIDHWKGYYFEEIIGLGCWSVTILYNWHSKSTKSFVELGHFISHKYNVLIYYLGQILLIIGITGLEFVKVKIDSIITDLDTYAHYYLTFIQVKKKKRIRSSDLEITMWRPKMVIFPPKFSNCLEVVGIKL